MLAILAIFGSSIVIALSGAMMPGPLLTVTISETPRRGMWTGPLLIAGHGLLECGLVVGLMLGLAPLLARPEVFALVSLAGAGVLMWMGQGMLRALPRLTLTGAPAERRTNIVAAGILLTLSNPYFFVWWGTIGLGYILHSRVYGTLGVGAFLSGHLVGDLLWYALVSVLIWKGRRMLSTRIYRGLMGTCAVLLLVFAGVFGVAGVRQLLLM